MISKVQPGQEASERMALYCRMARIGPLRATYAGKFALAALAGILIPLSVFIVYLLLSRTDIATIYPAIAALVLACFAGFLGTLWMLRELLMPVELTAKA